MQESIWRKVSVPSFPKLSNEFRGEAFFDTVIVGGGITGLMTAYRLKKLGQKVCVLERDRIAAGETGNTTAHLTEVTDIRLGELVKGFGEENAKLVWQAGAIAVDYFENIVNEHGINCKFHRVPGFLHSSLERKNGHEEIPDFKADALLARKLGFEARFEESVPIVGRPGIGFANQAKFHPLMFLAGLASLIPGQGSAIYEHSEVTQVDSDPLVIHCDGIAIRAENLVIATHVPIIGKRNLLSATIFQTKISSYSSYVLGASVEKGVYPEVSLWDTSDPYYYLRVDPSAQTDYIIFGGKDHKTGMVQDTERRYEELEERLLEIIPEAKVEYRWSGQVVEAHDNLPLIGEVSPKQFIATGFCGNGFTFGTVAALMAQDWIQGNHSPLEDLFSPGRKEIQAGGAWNYVKENIDFPVCFLKDRLSPAPDFAENKVKKDDGKILVLDGKRVACSRDDKGKLHVVSAVCTHMGCLVRWNNAERTWDCPCHGSRFQCDGSVMAGPAEEPLEKVSLPGK